MNSTNRRDSTGKKNSERYCETLDLKEIFIIEIFHDYSSIYSSIRSGLEMKEIHLNRLPHRMKPQISLYINTLERFAISTPFTDRIPREIEMQ